MPTAQTVFVVEDDLDFATTLGWLIESAGFAVEIFGSAQQFLDVFDPARPGCLLLDVRLRGLSGLELLDRLGRRGSLLPVIMMTGYADFNTAVRALKGGAADILQKPVDHEALLERVRKAVALDEATRAERTERAAVSARMKLLTPRERAVVELLVAGRRSKEIATELELSVRTVEAYRTSIMDKMEATSAAHLVRMIVLANTPAA